MIIKHPDNEHQQNCQKYHIVVNQYRKIEPRVNQSNCQIDADTSTAGVVTCVYTAFIWDIDQPQF